MKRRTWPLCVSVADYAMNTFASSALSGFSSFELVLVCSLPDLLNLTLPPLEQFTTSHKGNFQLLKGKKQNLKQVYCLTT